ncbi:hypothetical protein SLEP1_g25500 [Rubroshorea leprosula]|uniref:Uncharacterized protein n=1 Tax=Rubroshorea leprosula TaxID=152421 RepID=A0AAV5JRB4_9ROSI|nr:hypothetical protein SLEP1_g25500 [Rubroshorea leprosula]
MGLAIGRSNGEGIGSENSRDFGPQFCGMGLEIGWESLGIGWAAVGREEDLARPLLGEEKEADLAWRKAGYWAKKKKQILHGERPVVGRRRRSKSCMEKGRLLRGEVVGMGWAAVGWRRRLCTEKKQIENSRDFTPKSWSGKEEERWEKKESGGITTCRVQECFLLSSWHATY